MRKERTIAQPNVWRYELPGGWIVLAGKTSFDNELLSLQYAKADDVWFHSCGCPGSHVVLQSPEGEEKTEPPREILLAAASIAAWHSKGRNASSLQVDCTHAKYVSKPPHSPEGTVTITHEKILKVKPGLPN